MDGSQRAVTRAAPYALVLLAVLGATILPHLLAGAQTYILIHDHLDSRAAWAAILGQQNALFASPLAIIEPFMGGQARWQFGKPFDVYYMLFAVLPPLDALIVNEVLQRIMAFGAMVLLVQPHLLGKHPQAVPIAIAAAAGFAALPFWPGAGLDVAATPLLLSAYLDTRIRRGVVGAFLVALLAGLFVSPFYLGVFAASCWGLFWLRDLAFDRRAALGPSFWFIAIFCFGQIVGEYQMLWAYFSGAIETSHRGEIRISTSDLEQVLRSISTNFSEGQYHATPAQERIILPLGVAALIVAALAAIRAVQFRVLATRLFMVFLVILTTAAIFAAYRLDAFQAAWIESGLPYFNISRFHWLQPMLWASAFALSMGIVAGILSRWPRIALAAIAVLGLAQTLNALSLSDIAAEAERNGITFEDFVSADLFDAIRAETGPPSRTNRVGSVGLHPAISQINDFWTVDGYTNLYPLRYKRAFRAVIADELAENDNLRSYYDTWGNRVYLFSAALWGECGGLCTRERAPAAVNVQFDAEAFRALGGRYIISAAAIENAAELGIVARGVFTDPLRPWQIHLYQVNPGEPAPE